MAKAWSVLLDVTGCAMPSHVRTIDHISVTVNRRPASPHNMTEQPHNMTEQPLNFLFLHGYTQSGPLFSAKTKAVQKHLQKAFPLSIHHFPTAPHRLVATQDETGDNYAWWRRDYATDECLGLEETFLFLSEYLDAHGPFTGVIGFSQGGALAAMLAASLEPSRAWKTAGLATTHGPLAFAVCCSGFRVPGEVYQRFYEPCISTPILHIIGSLDTVVSEGRSLALAEACNGQGKQQVVYHPGGHYLPSSKGVMRVLVGFIGLFSSGVGGAGEGTAEDMQVPS
jgi:predicted esterase